MRHRELIRRLSALPNASALLADGVIDTADTDHVNRWAELLLQDFRRRNERASFDLLVELTSERLAKTAIAITRQVAVAVAPKHLVVALFTELFTDLRADVEPEPRFLASAAARMRAIAEEMVGTLARTVVADAPLRVPAVGAAIRRLPTARGGRTVGNRSDGIGQEAAADGMEAAAARRLEPLRERPLAPILPLRPRGTVERFGAYPLAVYMACYHALEHEDRRILLLKDVDDLSYREIAESMELRLDEIAPRLRYARERLSESVDRMMERTAAPGEDPRPRA